MVACRHEISLLREPIYYSLYLTRACAPAFTGVNLSEHKFKLERQRMVKMA